MRTVSVLTAVALLIGIPGCQTPLDRRQLELIQSWGEANRAFATAIEVYQKELGSVMDDYLEYQRAAQQRALETFLATNSRAGVLIETDDNDQPVLGEDGQPRPMKVAHLQTEIAFYTEQLKKIDEKRQRWEHTQAQVQTAITLFKQMNEMGIATSAEIANAMASVQALLETSLGTLGGFVAGVGAGIAVP